MAGRLRLGSERLEDRRLLAMMMDFVPDAGEVSHEGGTKVVTVEGLATLTFSADLLSVPDEAINNFQLNFENSDDALGISDWTFGPAPGGWTPTDATLDTAVGDDAVEGGLFIGSVFIGTEPTSLGEFELAVPALSGDYRLTVASDPGPNQTAITLLVGTEATIEDYGDVIIRVLGNDRPTANDDHLTTDEEQPLTIDVAADLLANDTDPDGDALDVSVVSQPANGSLTDHMDGTFTYLPAAGFVGEDSFVYRVDDGREGTDTATVFVTVEEVIEPGVRFDFVPDSGAVSTEGDVKVVTVGHDRTVGFAVDVTSYPTEEMYSYQLNFEPSDDALLLNSWTAASQGPTWQMLGILDTSNEQYVVGAGSFTDTVPIGDDPRNLGAFELHTPTTPGDYVLSIAVIQGFRATAVEIADGDQRVFAPVVSYGDTIIRVVEIFGPDATDDSLATIEETSLTIDASADLLSNDSDPVGNGLTIVGVSDPANGTLTDNGDGTYRYDPDPDFDRTDTFTYTVSDGEGQTDSATVSIAVAGTNDPTIAVDDLLDALEDTPLTIDLQADLFANDLDPDTGEVLSLASNTATSNGMLINNGDGTLTYTPFAQFVGTDTFTYTVSDSAGETDTATVTITVIFVDDPPVAVDDGVFTIQENTTLVLDVQDDLLVNDTDEENDPLTLIDFGQPGNGAVVDNGDGTLSYTPDPDFFSLDSFTYTVSDGNGGTDTATVSIMVANVNQAPRPGDDQLETDEDVALTIDIDQDLLANDTDPDGEALSLVGVGTPGTGSVVDNGDGTLTYTPGPDVFGSDTFTYTVSDGVGGTATATVTVVIAPQEDPPTAGDDFLETAEEQPLVISLDDLLANDFDPDGGGVQFIAASDAGAAGTVVNNGDGTITFTPAQDFTGDDRFTYFIQDELGLTAAATVTVSVIAQEDPPTAATDEFFTDEDQGTVISVDALLANDFDADGDDFSFVDVQQPAHGTLTDNGDGTYDYTPAPDFNGTDSFTYSIIDDTGLTGTGTVLVHVAPVNDDPLAVDDLLTTDEDVTLTIVLATDLYANDVEVDGDMLVLAGFTATTRGIVTNNGDGTLTYVPDPDFHGTDSFTYTIVDEGQVPSSATVTIEVLSVNDPPFPGTDFAAIDEDQPLTIDPDVDLLINDTDADGDPVGFVSFADPDNGSVIDNGDGTHTYQPDQDFHGTDTVSYTVTDGNGGTSIGALVVTVAPINDPPVAAGDTLNVVEGNRLFIIAATDLLANDIDVDGDDLVLVEVTEAAHGTLVNQMDGSLTYDPDPNFSGTDSFTYTISDGNGATSTATVDIVVQSVNDPPVARDDQLMTDEDTPLTIDIAMDLLGNDTDGDGDTLVIVAVGDPSFGSLTDNQDGTYTYAPEQDFHGTDSFVYTISDEQGVQDSATVSITVQSVNDLPVVQDDDYQMTQFGTLQTTALTGVLANDSDVESILAPTVLNDADYGQLTLSPDGSFTYEPNEIFWGTDTFTYSVDDGDGGSATGTVTIHVTPLTPWRNPRNALDVNDDGRVEPADALGVINKINREGTTHLLPFPPPGAAEPPPYVDTTGDNALFPDDVLRVINYLNRQIGSEGEAESLSDVTRTRAIDALFSMQNGASTESRSGEQRDEPPAARILPASDVHFSVDPPRISAEGSSSVYRHIGTLDTEHEDLFAWALADWLE